MIDKTIIIVVILLTFAADADSRVMSAKQYLHCEERKIAAQKLSIALDKEIKEVSMNYSKIRQIARNLEQVKREVRNRCY